MPNFVEFHAIDVDGVLFNEEYHKLCTPTTVDYGNITKTSLNLIKQVASQMQASKSPVKRILSGSNRQSLLYDLINDVKIKEELVVASDGTKSLVEKDIRVGSGFLAVEAFADEVKKEVKECVLDTFSMADIYSGWKAGVNYDATRSIQKTIESLYKKDVEAAVAYSEKAYASGTDANWAFDDYKLSIVYAHIHKIMTEFKDVTEDGQPVGVNYHLYEDREDILAAIAAFFEKNKALRPKRLNLFLHHYKSDNDITLYRELRANPNGLIDEHWRESVLEMASFCGYTNQNQKAISPNEVFENNDVMQEFLRNRDKRMGIGPKQVKFAEATSATQAQRDINQQARDVINGKYLSGDNVQETKEESEVAISEATSYSSRGSSLYSSSASQILHDDGDHADFETGVLAESADQVGSRDDHQSESDDESVMGLRSHSRSSSVSHLLVRSRQPSRSFSRQGSELNYHYQNPSAAVTPRAADSLDGRVFHYDQSDSLMLGATDDSALASQAIGIHPATRMHHQASALEHSDQFNSTHGGYEIDEGEDEPSYEEEFAMELMNFKAALAELDDLLHEGNQYDASLKRVGWIIANELRNAHFQTEAEIKKAIEVLGVTRIGIVEPGNVGNFVRCQELANEATGQTNYWKFIGGCLLVMTGIILLGASITLGVLSNGFMTPVSLQGLVISQSLIQSGVAATSLVLGAAAVIKGPSMFCDGFQQGIAKGLSKFWKTLQPMQPQPEPPREEEKRDVDNVAPLFDRLTR
ncbi:MAG: hypothetical protein P4M14_10770 [Gammaproteobacteria bacterium]|nr:hypothetical protein [Gammaproteobacteria bacterium]